jgi:uncharacterized protein (DUF1697 family)
MPRYVAFLRGINVGGHVVGKDALCKPFTALGLEEVESFIASGNVLFTARSGSATTWEKRLAERLEKALGYEVATFVRTGAEVAAIATYRPFRAAVPAGGSLLIGFLEHPVAATDRKALDAFKSTTNDFHVEGREVYWLCKTPMLDSKLNYKVFEKTLKSRATFRNMNTIQRITKKYELTAK